MLSPSLSPHVILLMLSPSWTIVFKPGPLLSNHRWKRPQTTAFSTHPCKKTKPWRCHSHPHIFMKTLRNCPDITIWNYVLSFCLFCLFVFLSFCLFVFLSFCLFVFLSFCLFVFLSFCLFVFLSRHHFSSPQKGNYKAGRRREGPQSQIPFNLIV